MRVVIILLLAVTLLRSSPASVQTSITGQYQVPPTLNDGWKTANADLLGVDSAQLSALTRSIRSWPELGVHAVLIERNGKLIYEEYFDGFDERWGQPLGRISMRADTRHDLRSVTKSVVSALVGIAVAREVFHRWTSLSSSGFRSMLNLIRRNAVASH
jgi:CubicO group peptidase (beta-lactamase class C family)